MDSYDRTAGSKRLLSPHDPEKKKARAEDDDVQVNTHHTQLTHPHALIHTHSPHK